MYINKHMSYQRHEPRLSCSLLNLSKTRLAFFHSYAKKAKDLSFIFHDRLTKPGAELAHWVEHVVRTRGARHLRSPAWSVPLYQRLYLDFLALILASIAAFRYLVGKLFKKSPKKHDQKKRN